MSQASLFTDSSCYHAAFATILRATDPLADPFHVLGSNASTAARLGADGLLEFGDPLEPLTTVLARQGYDVVQHEVRGVEQWHQAADALRAGRVVAIAAESFHLEHYWVGYRTSHALHVVVLQDYDAADATVRLTDPGEVVFLDDRVPLGSLEPAMCEDDAGQAWIELVPRRTPPAASGRAELSLLADSLSGKGTAPGTGGSDGAGPPWISGTALVEAFGARLDTYLELVSNRPGQDTGDQPVWGVRQWLPLGLWWYHHTLRWLAAHLKDPAYADTSSGLVAQASRDILVVRNLMMRLSVMDPESPRARTFRAQLAVRLDSAGRQLGAAGAALAAQAAEAGAAR